MLKPSPALHPSQRFRAPTTIGKGTALKDLLDAAHVDLLAESLAGAARFDRRAFLRRAKAGLNDLELTPRAAHLAAVMRDHLSLDDAAACTDLVASLGPPLTATEGNGLAVFFYLPHSACLAGLVSAWDAGMDACHALTRRFTAEFAVRPFIAADPLRAVRRFRDWVADPDPHVRRLVSEGSRPRLPWAGRLRCFQRDPRPILPLLDLLVDDPSPYVRRSVANHIGDLLKDHPDLGYARCRLWLKHPTEDRRAIVRHAVRLPARKGVPEAVDLRRAAGGR